MISRWCRQKRLKCSNPRYATQCHCAPWIFSFISRWHAKTPRIIWVVFSINRFSSGDLSTECDDVEQSGEAQAAGKPIPPPLQTQPMPGGPPNIPPPPGKTRPDSKHFRRETPCNSHESRNGMRVCECDRKQQVSRTSSPALYLIEISDNLPTQHWIISTAISYSMWQIQKCDKKINEQHGLQCLLCSGTRLVKSCCLSRLQLPAQPVQRQREICRWALEKGQQEVLTVILLTSLEISIECRKFQALQPHRVQPSHVRVCFSVSKAWRVRHVIKAPTLLEQLLPPSQEFKRSTKTDALPCWWLMTKTLIGQSTSVESVCTVIILHIWCRDRFSYLCDKYSHRWLWHSSWASRVQWNICGCKWWSRRYSFHHQL
jgi:hypothetical protein